MSIYTQFIVKSSIEIDTTPEEIWNFFKNIEENYKMWHPKEHIYFKWVKGKPLELGSKIDSEEAIDGHKVRIKGTCIESEKNKIIVFKPNWPVSFICPRIEWVIEKKGENSIFIANTYYKFGKMYLKTKKDKVDFILKVAQKHMDEEGENLKKILEQKNNE